MMPRIHISTGFAVLIAILCANASSAVPVYSNFDTGDTYDTTGGWLVTGPTSGFQSAMRFVPSGQYQLDAVDLAVSLVTSPNELDVSLAADNSDAPGATLESFHFSGAMGSFGDLNPPLHASSILHPLLSSGATYWLVASATDGTTALWNYNSIGDLGGAQSISGGEWTFTSDNATGAFRITPVPEPGALSFLGAGTLGLIAYLRLLRKKRARPAN